MKRSLLAALAGVSAIGLLSGTANADGAYTPEKITALKATAIKDVDARAKLAQVMNDMIFSFGELGYQEVETSKYITGILEKNGFKVTRGISGLPTGWTATWTQGSGGPVIALGSDIDCIPKASQKPGVAAHDPIVPGAPGHGEGHNSGQALNVVAALALKDLMAKEHIAGTLMLWPGVAEELVGAKAYMVRDGIFKDVDATIFTHVGDTFQARWGFVQGTGLVSVKYHFHGEAAHAAMAPWRGKSALDAVELMDIGWNFRREHLKTEQRSHRVIFDGGDQPNVVPSEAGVWYYFRQQSFADIQTLYDTGNKMATAAAMMTDTTVDHEVVGAAAPGHFNKPIAEAASENIQTVGMPVWTPEENAFAQSVQRLVGAKEKGLETQIPKLEAPPEKPPSGGSDDIGDISWTMPTIVLNYPSNIPGLQGHHWSNAISMATPIAHKGIVAGAKVMAMTVLDLLTKPEVLANAKSYFTDVQTKDQKYISFLAPTDKPVIEQNAAIMAKFRPEMAKYYYNPDRYPSYLAQLGIAWPPAPAK
jgi:aminobenzoyl-glutamate utilization protein B